MAIKQYLDWRGWMTGFYLSWVKTLTNTLLAVIGTNGAQALGVQDIGLNWKEALGMAGSITVVEALRYLNAKPKPDTVTTEEVTETKKDITTVKTTVTDKTQQ